MYYYTASDSIFKEIRQTAQSMCLVPVRAHTTSWLRSGSEVFVLKDFLPPVVFRGIRRAMGGKEIDR